MERQITKNLKIMLFLVIGLSSVLGFGSVDVFGRNEDGGAVFTMTNATTGNAVLAFHRSGAGALTAAGTFATGGLGTGGREPDFGLANAGALALSADNHLLFVVNPGSDDISVFAVGRSGLSLLDRKNSGGHQPISLTVSDDLLYVLNAGGNVGGQDNITGFSVSERGHLTLLSNSIRMLSADTTSPAQIRFSPDGKVLVVTERVANNIDTYTVGRNGRATGPRITHSAGNPFGMDFGRRNQLFVADDFNDDIGMGAASSFIVSDDGSLHLVSSAIPSFESGACWARVSPDGRFLYISNTVSSKISLYGIEAHSGAIDFRGAFSSLYSPTDMDSSRDGRFLYALDPDQNGLGSPGITVFHTNSQDGTLTPLAGVTGLAPSVDGLAAY